MVQLGPMAHEKIEIRRKLPYWRKPSVVNCNAGKGAGCLCSAPEVNQMKSSKCCLLVDTQEKTFPVLSRYFCMVFIGASTSLLRLLPITDLSRQSAVLHLRFHSCVSVAYKQPYKWHCNVASQMTKHVSGQ